MWCRTAARTMVIGATGVTGISVTTMIVTAIGGMIQVAMAIVERFAVARC